LAHVSQTFLVGVEALSGPLFDAQGRLAAALTIITRPGQLDLTPNGPVARQLREFADRIRGA
jgi:DNA-binding IclR family transcriptional regulator